MELLPNDLLQIVFSHFTANDILNVLHVCKSWRILASDEVSLVRTLILIQEQKLWEQIRVDNENPFTRTLESVLKSNMEKFFYKQTTITNIKEGYVEGNSNIFLTSVQELLCATNIFKFK